MVLWLERKAGKAFILFLIISGEQSSMKKISVVVPCYNEEATIAEFHNTVSSLWKKEHMSDKYELELLFINDGSSDSTHSIISSLSEKDKNVRYTSFSRNFGKEAAIFCGLKQATGDAVIVMDSDLQHPPATMIEMISKWEEGFDIVEGVKSNRGKESRSHGLFAGLFYKMISRMVGFDMAGSSDYKLIDRKAVDTLNSLPEKATFFRALSYWIGFNQTVVKYEVADRVAGESKWSGLSLLKYAVSNLTSFTYAPLHLIAIVGSIIILIGFGLGVDAIISYIHGESVGGYPSLVILITLATGGIMLSLGVIAVYIAKMYSEIKGRPRYIIDKQK